MPEACFFLILRFQCLQPGQHEQPRCRRKHAQHHPDIHAAEIPGHGNRGRGQKRRGNRINQKNNQAFPVCSLPPLQADGRKHRREKQNPRHKMQQDPRRRHQQEQQLLGRLREKHRIMAGFSVEEEKHSRQVSCAEGADKTGGVRQRLFFILSRGCLINEQSQCSGGQRCSGLRSQAKQIHPQSQAAGPAQARTALLKSAEKEQDPPESQGNIQAVCHKAYGNPEIGGQHKQRQRRQPGLVLLQEPAAQEPGGNQRRGNQQRVQHGNRLQPDFRIRNPVERRQKRRIKNARRSSSAAVGRQAPEQMNALGQLQIDLLIGIDGNDPGKNRKGDARQRAYQQQAGQEPAAAPKTLSVYPCSGHLPSLLSCRISRSAHRSPNMRR